jgi:protocatechuate 3,4-dioxygenase beta subunit
MIVFPLIATSTPMPFPLEVPTDRFLARRRLLALIAASGASLLGGARPSLAGASSAVCVARPEQTEGPFFVDERLNRSDIRSDPRSGETRPGVPLRLELRVSRLAGTNCSPLAGAQVDVWHSDAEGRYSDAGGFGSRTSTKGQQFLRGYQITDAAGAAQFLTIYPGWYGGRAVHVHFKIRMRDPADRVRDFTSQLYFDDAFTERIFAAEPYASRGRRWLRNADDGLFRDGGSQLLLTPEAEGKGYVATFDVAIA